MMSFRWMKSIAVALLLVPASAFADILFMDLNNNPKEIEAAERAAAKRGEKVIVIPLVTAKQKADLKRVEAEIKSTENQTRSLCNGNNTSPDCQTLKAKLSGLYKEVSKLKPNLDQDSLTAALKELKQQKVQLSSVVVSGHDGNGNFSGSQGNLSDAAIKEAFDKAAPLGASVRSLLLWGCYTTTVGSLEFNWKKVLPNVSMIAGWELKGLLGNSAANWNYLEDVLTKEKALTSAGDQKALQKIFNGIRYVNDQTHRSAVCLNNETIVSPKGVTTISKEMSLCNSLRSGELTEKLQCYEKASPGCEDVPADTSAGPLRALYNEIQKTSHCRDLVPSSVRMPSADRTVRLLFDRDVRKNFENLNRDGLSELNNLLKEMQAPENLQIKGLDKLTRKEFLDKIANIERWIDQKAGPLKDEFGRFDDAKLLALKNAIGPLKELSEVHDSCIPFSWVEPGSQEIDKCHWNSTMKDSRKQGAIFSAIIMTDRDEENAKFKVGGTTLKQAYLRREESRLQQEKLINTRAPEDQIRKADDDYFKAEKEIGELESRVLPKIANERIQYYEDKLKNASTLPNEVIKSYQDRLYNWKIIRVQGELSR